MAQSDPLTVRACIQLLGADVDQDRTQRPGPEPGVKVNIEVRSMSRYPGQGQGRGRDEDRAYRCVLRSGSGVLGAGDTRVYAVYQPPVF